MSMRCTMNQKLNSLLAFYIFIKNEKEEGIDDEKRISSEKSTNKTNEIQYVHSHNSNKCSLSPAHRNEKNKNV